MARRGLVIAGVLCTCGAVLLLRALLQKHDIPDVPAPDAPPDAPAGDLRSVGGTYPGSASGDWEKGDGDGSFAWRPSSGSAYRRYTRQEALRCVKDKHLVFVGDSVLRYIYVSMLWWLHHGRWPNSRVTEASNQFLSGSFGTADPLEQYGAYRANGSGSVVWQKEWPTWEAYLRGSTAGFGGAMCCDCLRAPQPHVNKRRVIPARTMRRNRERHWLSQRENRFYSAPDGSFRASFFFLHGDFKGNGMTPGFHRGCGTKMMGANASEPADWPPAGWKERWRGTTPALQEALKEAGEQADAVVFNTGLWYPTWIKEGDSATRAVDAVEAMLKKPGLPAVWQTVTQQCQRLREPLHETPVLDAIKDRKGWTVFDAGWVTERLTAAVGMPLDQLPRGHAAAMEMKQFGGLYRGKCSAAFVDTNGHFQPYVYKELVVLLLNALGC